MIESKALREGVLINHPSQFAKYQNIPKIYHEEYLAKLDIESNQKNLFYCLEFSEYEQEIVSRFSESWFLGENDEDLSVFGSVSWGHVIHSTVFITLVMAYREYRSIEFWLDRFDIIYVSKFQNKFFIDLMKNFEGRLKFIEDEEYYSNIISSSNDRILNIHSPRKIIKLLGYIQDLIKNRVQKKIIFINDWTYKNSVKKRKDSLMVNAGINIFRSVYFNACKHDLCCPDSIYDFIKEHEVKIKFSQLDSKFVNYLLEHIESHYQTNKNYFINSASNFIQIIKKYLPIKVVFPAEMYPDYVIGIYICRSENVEAWLCLDGFLATPSRPYFLKYSVGRESIFTGVIAAGKSNYDYFDDGRFKKLKLVTCEPPMLSVLKTMKHGRKKKYDLMIMTLMPLDCRLSGFIGGRINSIVDILMVAKKIGFEKLAIKLKNKSERLLAEYAINISEINPLAVDLIDGPAAPALVNAKYIIGGLSTTVAEAAFLGIPYLVYEPKRNGYTNQDIELSKIVSKDLVARNPEELFDLVKSRVSSVSAEFDYLFGGKKLENLNF